MRLLGNTHGIAVLVFVVAPLLATLTFGACGGMGSTAAGTTSAASSGTGGNGAGGNGTGGGGVECGPTLLCGPHQVCIVDEMDTPCSPAPEDGGACAPGTTMSLCGGIGYPCCCGQAPPSDFRCEPLPDCDGGPSCECAGDVCGKSKMCQMIGGKPSELHCVSPPQP